MKLKILTASAHITLCLLTAQITAQEPSKKSKSLTDPYVAWAEGQEVEIRFRVDKIRAVGLTLKDLEDVERMRFLGDNWTRTIKNVKVDLKEIAEIKFRPLQAPVFTVKLLDGREAIITPFPKKISAYMVTGGYFQQEVIDCLDSPLVEDPAKTVVMRGLRVFGDLPHSTGPDRIHRSLGEPLEKFGRVEFRGKPGSQAAELSRMRVADYTVLEAMGWSKGTSRELIEKRYGPGKASDPRKPNGPREYSLKSGRIEVHWNETGKNVDYIYALHGKDLPTAKADEPEKLAKQARTLADANRAILLEFLSKTRDTQTAEESRWIRQLLSQSQAQLRWSDADRHLMLGDGNK